MKEEKPRVSIIVPCRNEVGLIERSLGSILAQDYSPERLEVLVVDGMSDDGTREIVRRVIDKSKQSVHHRQKSEHGKCLGPAIVLLDNPFSIVPRALNLGLRHARGEIIFRLDGHSEMAPNYVSTCVAKLQARPDVACVGGPSVAYANGSGWIGNSYALALQSSFGVGGGTFRTARNECYVDTLAFGGCRREIFNRLGNFDPDLERNQDIEFNARIRRAGGTLLLTPETHTRYHVPENLKAMIQQNYRNGYWNTKPLGKMLKVLSWRHFVPLLFVSVLLMTFLGTLAVPWLRYPLFLVLGSYAFAALLVCALMAFRVRRPYVFFLPPLFTIMHVSYGLGSLVGICRYVRDRFQYRNG